MEEEKGDDEEDKVEESASGLGLGLSKFIDICLKKVVLLQDKSINR